MKLPLSWNGTLADDPLSVNRSWPLGLQESESEKKTEVEIDVRSHGKVKVIKLRGRLNLGEAVDRLRQKFDELLNDGDSYFVIDLGEISMIDSSGIGLLVRCLTAAKQKSGALKLLNPSKFAQQTLRMTGLHSLFEVFTDQEQAVASFQ